MIWYIAFLGPSNWGPHPYIMNIKYSSCITHDISSWVTGHKPYLDIIALKSPKSAFEKGQVDKQRNSLTFSRVVSLVGSLCIEYLFSHLFAEENVLYMLFYISPARGREI